MSRCFILMFVLKVISIILSIAVCVLKVAQIILKERHRREDAEIEARIHEIEEEIKRLEAKDWKKNRMMIAGRIPDVVCVFFSYYDYPMNVYMYKR